jgi:hypothetical protein
MKASMTDNPGKTFSTPQSGPLALQITPGHHLQHDFASAFRWYGADHDPTFVAGDLSLISSHSDKEAAAARCVSQSKCGTIGSVPSDTPQV